MSSLLENYTLIPLPPSVQSYRHLRAFTGLSPRTNQQTSLALANSFFTCHIIYAPPNPPTPSTNPPSSPTPPEIVGMTRVFGDAGWYFVLADVCVLPAHQRRGLGELMVRRCLREIEQRAPPGAYVTVGADPPGRRLYERVGFRETAPETVGMAMILGAEGGTE
ncbi:GCN5-like N-acetyltransferase [Patellaria atrata CBS 101060]|uniref:GCN5-like N-acetyltransferase n=1 Tax=Patellaria atrata CBS 101060 TaxID=1346257 RepID=A0A9P4SHE6_9PEZI|nr:GCN5-like N-acetyltransferase [Patellaria atrata CBS 101060]